MYVLYNTREFSYYPLMLEGLQEGGVTLPLLSVDWDVITIPTRRVPDFRGIRLTRS
jgi:hypothetical protein